MAICFVSAVRTTLLSRVVAAYQITSTSRSFKIRTPGAGTGLCTHHGHLFRVSGTDHTGPCHGWWLHCCHGWWLHCCHGWWLHCCHGWWRTVVTGGRRTVLAALLSRVVAALLSRVVAHCCHGWSPHCFGCAVVTGGRRTVLAHCCHGWWLRCSGGCAVVTGGGRISDYVNKSILQDKDTRRRHWTLYPPWPSVSCQRYIPHWSLSRVVAAYQITSTSRSFKIRTPGAGTGLCTHHGHLFRVSGTDHTGPCHGWWLHCCHGWWLQ